MKKDVPDFDWFLEKLRKNQPGLILEEKLIRDAAEIIWNRIHSSLEVEVIVSKLPATRRTVERRFREQIKLSIREVVAIARLELAKWLLTETSLPIHMVAKESGYTSSDWMGKVIRRNSGMTPSDYRLHTRARERGKRKER